MRGRGRRGLSRALVGATLLVAAAGLAASGCSGRIVRLVEHERYDEAIAQVEDRRQSPRGKVARAYATALHKKGQHDRARALLLSDYRHGGDLRSLVAAADLERSLGLDGTAASHYGRAIDLSRDVLAGREDVCALLRERAGVWASHDAGEAAGEDLRRARTACGAPSDPAGAARLAQLEQEVIAAARREIDARVERSGCGDDCQPPGPDEAQQQLDATLDQLREQGPAALRLAAIDRPVALPAQDIVDILAADLRGEAGAPLLTDDEVRSMVAGRRWSDLAPVTMSQPPAVAAYIQLRLAVVLPDMPMDERSGTGPGQRDLWLAQALQVDEAHAWRVLGWAGDLTAVELTLSAQWRPKRASATDLPGDETDAAEAPPAVEQPVAVGTVEPPSHWAARAPLTAESRPPLLLEGRLRQLAGHPRLGLQLHRYLAASSYAAELPGTDEAVAREAAWHLAHGRPWHALAIADTVPRPESQRVAAAAATALRLTEAFCGGACNDDLDRSRVERSVSEAWVQKQQRSIVERSRATEGAQPAAFACPTLAELLAPDATGQLALGLRAALAGDGGSESAARLGAAIEADLGLDCASRWAVPLLREGGHVPTAKTIADALAHDAALEAYPALLTHALVAIAAGQADRGWQLAVAAAARSLDPAQTWRVVARHAHAAGLRELSRVSVRQALMHSPGTHDPALHRALVVSALAAVRDSWNQRQTDAGRAEAATHIRDFLESVPEPRRWATRASLARVLAQQPWLDADAAARLRPALWPDEDGAADPIGRAWIDLGAGAAIEIEPTGAGPLDLAAAELLLAAGKTRELSPAALAFVEPPRLEAARLAVARHSDAWVARWRTAIGLMAYGTPAGRAQAAEVLLSMAEPDQREALIRVLIDNPAVIEPGTPGHAAARLLATPEDQLTVIFGLPPDPLGV